MVKYINAEKLKRIIEKKYRMDGWVAMLLKRIIDDEPFIDVEKIKHGKWEDGFCSVCGEEEPATENGFGYESNYCPHCGAKMDKE